MRYWGVAISVFYALLLAALLLPSWIFLSHFGDAGFEWRELNYFSSLSSDPSLWTWLLPWLLLLLAGQALLLTVPVDRSRRRLRPRQTVLRTAVASGLLVALLATAGAAAVLAAIVGDDGGDFLLPLGWAAILLIVWLGWAAVFTLYHRAGVDSFDRVVRWVLRGSVLELLVAVSSHAVVRHRDDCCAPVVTSWGIVTGLAVMAACFGPGILALLRARIEAYGPSR